MRCRAITETSSAPSQTSFIGSNRCGATSGSCARGARGGTKTTRSSTFGPRNPGSGVRSTALRQPLRRAPYGAT